METCGYGTTTSMACISAERAAPLAIGALHSTNDGDILVEQPG